MKPSAHIVRNIVAAVGLGAWLLAAFDLLAAYLKALGLAGAEIGELGIAIAEIGELPRSLALLLAMTAALWLGSERLVQGRPVLRRQLPLAFSICGAALITAVFGVHFGLAAGAEPQELALFGGLTWPLLALTLAIVTGAGSVVALLARASEGRAWPAVFAGLPGLAAVLFYAMVTRRIADYGVDTDTAGVLPLIFPRPWTLIAGLAIPTVAVVGLTALGRRVGAESSVASALVAVAPWLYALHAVVCLGTAAPLMLMSGFAVDDRVRQVNERSTWILAAAFAAAWIALYAVQRRRYRARRAERS